MNKSLIVSVLTTIGICLLSACSNDEPVVGDRADNLLKITATIEPHAEAASMTTRAGTRPDDKMGYYSFSTGDVIGFFVDGSVPGAPYHDKLPFEKSSFVTYYPESIDVQKIKTGNAFAYFPYEKNLVAPFTRDINQNKTVSGSAGENDVDNPEPYNDGKGVPLRREKDGTDVCLDLLLMKSLNNQATAVQITSVFTHAFSELLLVRGDGFDHPKKPEGKLDERFNGNYENIVIVLKPGCGYSHVVLTDEGTNGTPLRVKLLPAELEKQNEKDRFWYAKKTTGANVKDGYGNTHSDAWYVILPTMETSMNGRYPVAWSPGDKRTVIDYVLAYDNSGKMQLIDKFSLVTAGTADNYWYNGEKALTETVRYNLILEMVGTVPTLSPWSIKDWQDDVDITDARPSGVTDDNDFYKWLTAYNGYIANNRKDDRLEIIGPDDYATAPAHYVDRLLQYGDAITEAVDDSDPDAESKTPQIVGWKFRITMDIDWANVQKNATTGTAGLRLQYLQDTLDFRGHVIKNYSGSAGFIGELGGWGPNSGQESEPEAAPAGCIMNAKFTGLDVTSTDTSAKGIGGIADYLLRGGIINCTIEDGQVTAASTVPVGMAVGRLSSIKDSGNIGDYVSWERWITGCSFTGSITGGDSSHKNMVGVSVDEENTRNTLVNNQSFVEKN